MGESNGYISKHKKYIDYRLAIISENLSLDSIERKHRINAIITRLIDKSHNTCLPLIPDKNLQAVQELTALVSEWNYFDNGDIIGYIYQTLEHKMNRKNKGQYFTPDDIVSFLTKQSIRAINREDATILDPACGSGQFLVHAYKLLYSIKLQHGNTPEYAAKSTIKNLYGIDIDPMAVKIASHNLMQLSGCTEQEIKIFHRDFLNKDNTLVFDNRNPFHSPKEMFDIIIGNPPWRSTFTTEEKQYYKEHYSSIDSGSNTFTLFIERSFDFIKNDGAISFLLPEAYLNIRAHMSSRQYVLGKACIKSINLWGERFKGVFAPSASILLQKERKEEIRKKNIIQCANNTSRKEGIALLIPQASYLNTPENIFNIHHSRKAADILSIIEQNGCMYLKENAKFFLGIVTGNNTKYISDHQTCHQTDPIIIGKDITQYRINFSGHYFQFNAQQLQQVAPHHLYLAKTKILYRFIGKRLTFALDTNGYYTLNNVNGFIPLSNENSIETILSILNSRVLQYYYQNNFFTLKVLRGNIERLPLKIIHPSVQKRLKKLVSMILESDDRQSAHHRETIEDIIFHEYNIKDREAHHISEMIH